MGDLGSCGEGLEAHLPGRASRFFRLDPVNRQISSAVDKGDGVETRRFRHVPFAIGDDLVVAAEQPPVPPVVRRVLSDGEIHKASSFHG